MAKVHHFKQKTTSPHTQQKNIWGSNFQMWNPSLRVKVRVTVWGQGYWRVFCSTVFPLIPNLNEIGHLERNLAPNSEMWKSIFLKDCWQCTNNSQITFKGYFERSGTRNADLSKNTLCLPQNSAFFKLEYSNTTEISAMAGSRNFYSKIIPRTANAFHFRKPYP